MAITGDTAILEASLWGFLLAWPDFLTLVKPGNRVRVDQLGIPYAELIKGSRLLTDAPELVIEPTTLRRNDNVAPTFGNTRGAGCARIIEEVVRFSHKITGVDRTINAIGQVRQTIQACYDSHLPNFGLSYVTGSHLYSGRYEVVPKAEAKGANARRIVLDLDLTMRFAA